MADSERVEVAETGAGDPAFPVRVYDGSTLYPVQYTGMLLRDYFAAHALAGILSNRAVCEDLTDEAKAAGVDFAKKVAVNAYGFADALMRERSR